MIIFYLLPVTLILYFYGFQSGNWSDAFLILFPVLGIEISILLGGNGGLEHLFSIKAFGRTLLAPFIGVWKLFINIPSFAMGIYNFLRKMTYKDLKRYIWNVIKTILGIAAVILFLLMASGHEECLDRNGGDYAECGAYRP